jgi:hypothetical protein
MKKNMYAQYINHFEDALDPFFCDQVVDFYNTTVAEKIETIYGVGENTSTRKILLENIAESNESISSMKEFIYSTIKDFTITSIIPHVYPMTNFDLEPIQIRKMNGPTLNHSDNVDPIYLNNIISYRVITILANISESSDILVFPKQNIRIPLTRKSIIAFPPYWMFEHFSESISPGRITIATWVREFV